VNRAEQGWEDRVTAPKPTDALRRQGGEIALGVEGSGKPLELAAARLVHDMGSALRGERSQS
jgi:hypothetical protein